MICEDFQFHNQDSWKCCVLKLILCVCLVCVSRLGLCGWNVWAGEELQHQWRHRPRLCFHHCTRDWPQVSFKVFKIVTIKFYITLWCKWKSQRPACNSNWFFHKGDILYPFSDLQPPSLHYFSYEWLRTACLTLCLQPLGKTLDLRSPTIRFKTIWQTCLLFKNYIFCTSLIEKKNPDSMNMPTLFPNINCWTQDVHSLCLCIGGFQVSASHLCKFHTGPWLTSQ